jgi:hypothetical protein
VCYFRHFNKVSGGSLGISKCWVVVQSFQFIWVVVQTFADKYMPCVLSLGISAACKCPHSRLSMGAAYIYIYIYLVCWRQELDFFSSGAWREHQLDPSRVGKEPSRVFRFFGRGGSEGSCWL